MGPNRADSRVPRPQTTLQDDSASLPRPSLGWPAQPSPAEWAPHTISVYLGMVCGAHPNGTTGLFLNPRESVAQFVSTRETFGPRAGGMPWRRCSTRGPGPDATLGLDGPRLSPLRGGGTDGVQDGRRMTTLSLFDAAEDPAGLWLETVSELTARIKAVLEVGFAEVALRAEISNVARPRSGHVYLVPQGRRGAGPRRALEERGAAARLRADRRPGGPGLGPADGLCAAGRVPGHDPSGSSPRGSARSSWRSARRWPGWRPRGCSTRRGSGPCPGSPGGSWS